MEKVFYNFISNSIKFSKSGGEVSVSLSLRGDSFVLIKIKDNGKGISKSTYLIFSIDFIKLKVQTLANLKEPELD
ncbi:MAG: sensor histidine kinase [Ignavibacteriae bacterium]|nr:sensor histidine kinase [Ignavibacteriota bacterium]